MEMEIRPPMRARTLYRLLSLRTSSFATRDPVLVIVVLVFAVLLTVALSIDVVRATAGVKGDEATYVAMALSVAHDGDLVYAREDVVRFFRIYGGGPQGIFLKPGRDANSNRLFFAKSYIYPVVAAPFARLAGLNGLLALNVLLFGAAFLCLYGFASIRLSPGGAALMSTAFLGASVAPLYSVFLAPETFNFAVVCYAYSLWLYKEVAPSTHRLPVVLRGRLADLMAAILLGLIAFSKPTNLPLVAPLVALAWWRRRLVDGVLIGATCCGVVIACFAVNAWITGEWNYQGGLARKTFYGEFPFEQPAFRFDNLGISVLTNDLRPPAAREPLAQFGRNLTYFLVGRHFGLVPYFFPALVVVAWLFWRRRALAPWQTFVAGMLILSACGFLFLFPNHWSGGGGPLGNRYFLGFYPAFFFLIPTDRSVIPGLIAWCGGVLFLAPALVNPLAAATSPWIIAQQGPLRTLPVELTMVNDLPARLDSRRSRVVYDTDPPILLYYLDENAWLPEELGIWTAGGKRADLVVRTNQTLASLTVGLSAPIDNRVTVTVDGTSKVADLQPNTSKRLTFPVRGVHATGAQNFVISVRSRDGVTARLRSPDSRDSRFLGVRLRLMPAVPGW